MIIYNITVKVDTLAAERWIAWTKSDHMKEVMDTGLFTDCRLCRLLEQDETDGITFVKQYLCAGIEEYDTYINKHSIAMREKESNLFAGKLVAFRSLMEII